MIWVGVAFFEAACWGAIVVLNKSVLRYVTPLGTNVLVRIASLVGVTAVTVPLTVLHLWDVTFAMTWSAFGYISIAAVVIWLVAFNTYYYALRSGRVGVVTPLTSIDPLFAALFAAALIGATIGGLTILGLAVATGGILLISRWMHADPAVGTEVLAPPTPGDVKTSRPEVVLLSLVTAAGWGLGPVLIQLALQSVGGASTTMMLQSQAMGLLMLGAVVLGRRARVLVRPLKPAERRTVVLLIVFAGVLETAFSVLYYLVIEHIGAVLTVLIGSTAPLFAILLGVLVLRERFGRRLALAAAVTLTGVFLATLDRL
ncbi:MAG TPA: DMT family transporter [Thermoleophilia bacterium]|nr:DMT family transporter [Thermoleophilia bacterium]